MRLEREIHARAGHAEVVLRPIHKIPTEITDPPDVRCYANFQPTADLTEGLGFSVSVSHCLDNIEVFSRLRKSLVDWPLTATKDSPASAENVWRKTGARNWITQCQCSQHGANRITVAADAVLKDVIAEILEDTVAGLIGTRRPTFDSYTEITHEEVFDVSSTSPSMIGRNVSIIELLGSGENVGAPKAHIELVICVPLRARRRSSYLLHFLSGIFSSGKRDTSECRNAAKA